MNQSKTKPANRLLALDIMRGITIAGMILVNNPGSWGNIYAPLRHAPWDGLTPTDLVFPFFMFIMGISSYFSLRKYDFRFSGACVWKILRRTIVIWLIGLTIAWFGLFLGGILGEKTFVEAVFCFDRIRILGVLPRLAICYGIGSVIAIALKPKALPWAVALLLVAYSIILFLGNGFAFSEENVISVVDRAVLGSDHMYTDSGLKFDPEGLLSTIPSIAHVLIGFICGALITRTCDNMARSNSLFIIGTILTFAGLLLSYGIPVNKKIWSPTFVLTTCGLAASLLALLIWIIDIKGRKKWCRFFESFGINPLFMYCVAAVLSIVIGRVKIAWAGTESGMITIKGYLYKAILMPLCGDDATLASLIFAILFVLLNWCIGYILYKKKIYIKI